MQIIVRVLQLAQRLEYALDLLLALACRALKRIVPRRNQDIDPPLGPHIDILPHAQQQGARDILRMSFIKVGKRLLARPHVHVIARLEISLGSANVVGGRGPEVIEVVFVCVLVECEYVVDEADIFLALGDLRRVVEIARLPTYRCQSGCGILPQFIPAIPFSRRLS